MDFSIFHSESILSIMQKSFAENWDENGKAKEQKLLYYEMS